MASKPQKSKKKTEDIRESWFKRNRMPVVLFLLTFLVYSNSLSNGYAMDDDFYIGQGETPGETAILIKKGFKGIPGIFRSRTFYNPEGPNYSYRPVVAASFAVEYQFFGANPGVSHFISVLLYAFTVVLLFLLLRKWFATQGDWFSFFIALLFLVHPLHTEIVDNIKSRDELFSLLGVLGCFWFVWKHKDYGGWHNLLLALLCFLFGMLSKHTIVVYLALLPLTLWFFGKTDWKKMLIYVLPVVAAIAIFLMMMRSTPHSNRHYLMHENPLASGHYGFAEKTATSFYVLARYLALHFFPHPLVYYYGFKYIPIVGWTNIIAILSLLIHGALAVLGLRGLIRKTIWGFGILFYLGCIVPYSNMLQLAPGLVAERFAYSATIGFSIVVVWLVFRLLKLEPESFVWKYSTKARTVFLVIAALFGIRSFARNYSWESKETLYAGDMEYLDESAKAHMLYAQYLAKDVVSRRNPENIQIAKFHFKRAVEIFPGYTTAWSNYAATFYFQKKYDSANMYFHKALVLDTLNEQTYTAMGMNYFSWGKGDSARWAFVNSIRLDSTYKDAYEGLARLMQSRGKYDNAIRLLATAARKNPKQAWPFIDMKQIYADSKKNFDSAAICLEAAAEINPHNLQVLQSLAKYYSEKGNTVKADKYRSMAEIEASRLENQNP